MKRGRHVCSTSRHVGQFAAPTIAPSAIDPPRFVGIIYNPSDTTSPKADISTWPEADIFILLLQARDG
jgi:hypothetical protein